MRGEVDSHVGLSGVGLDNHVMGDPGSRENPRYKGKEATYLDPLRYCLGVLRGVYLKGIGLDVLWIQLTAMGVFGTAMIAISVFLFCKSLD